MPRAGDAPCHFNCFDNRNTWFWYGDEDYQPQAHNYVFDPPIQSWRREHWQFSLVTSSRHFAGLRGSTPPAPDILQLAPALEADVAFVEALGSMLRTRDAYGEVPSLAMTTASEGDEGVFPCLFRWRTAASAGEVTLSADSFMRAVGLNPVIAEESRCYIDFKGRTFSSKDEEQAVSRELLNWGTHHEFMYGDCVGAEAAWAALNYHSPTAGGDSDEEERDYQRQASPWRHILQLAASCGDVATDSDPCGNSTWMPIMQCLAEYVVNQHLLVITCGSQRLLNPIPCFCIGESPSGNLVGFCTALVYT